MPGRPFPREFLFGCATSAHQIEGGTTNDWTAWEDAGRLKDPNARSGRTTDHWHRWREDFDLLSKDLGANAYRFSIEWSRIEPKPGEYDAAALAQYIAMLHELNARGIEPMITFLHFTHPPWFHELTPWHLDSPEPAQRFAKFVAHVAGALRGSGARAKFFTILNEPAPWLVGAYVAGVIPPGQKDIKLLAKAALNLVRAHAYARNSLHELLGNEIQIGIAHNILHFNPARRFHPGDQAAAKIADEVHNRAFPRALITGRMRLGMIPGLGIDSDVPEAKASLDFIGVNYYSRAYVAMRGTKFDPFYEDRDRRGLSDLGWETYPQGLTDALLEMSKYKLPLYVTENGMDDRDDTRRAAHLYDHLGALLDAIDRGADVRGYLHWSLLDNFEWLHAFGPRFGLYRVDYTTLSRTATRAAHLFRDVIAARALPDLRPEETIKHGTGPMPLY